ncbi:cysteine desulfurase family protein [Lunatibacter salilacus]|uniref:cysteine desulfurase family protein n=1 Tax=Lunatibacter salilacus TaxID=2483804 RepID=UPI00131EAD9B|nr:cysteine desulfurase family protein [Lunatibacter salilacus]
MKFPLYLDHNATTPCSTEVLEAMLPFFTEQYGNASSTHHPYGWISAEAVEEARERVAELIGSSPKEIVFTSGATEAINLAIRGTLFSTHNKKGKHVVTVSTEHAAVLDTCNALESLGIEVDYLSVGPNGILDLEELKKAIRKDTVLISVMVANNETGVIQPIQEIGEIARQNGIVFMADGVQAVGKIPVDVQKLQIDLLPLSAHKMYGPKGIGALYVRKNPKIELQSEITGGGHERGRRSGTLNVPGIVGLGKTAQIQQNNLYTEYQRLKVLRDRLESDILRLPGTTLNGDAEQRLPHVSNISFEGVESKALLTAINKAVAVSSGSACSSVTDKASHVLQAMGIPNDLAKATLRFSLGKFTTEDDIRFTIAHVSETLATLRKTRILT